jgi:hypothetical protein
MPCTYTQACDEMFDLFNAAWNAGSSAIVGYVPTIRWQDNDTGVLPINTAFWCRVSIQTIASGQTSFCSSVDAAGKRRYTTNGLFVIQIFGPKNRPEAAGEMRDLVEMILPTLRSKTTNVILRKATPNEISPENGCSRTNVFCEFEYDDIT